MDTVVSCKGSTGALLVLTDRCTRYQLIHKIKSKSAADVVGAVRSLRRSGYRFSTITVDNGCEFADYNGIRRVSGADVYYCHPYSSWERGSNECANAFIRRFIPKGTDISKVPKNKIEAVQGFINEYPRRIHGGKSAEELYRLLI